VPRRERRDDPAFEIAHRIGCEQQRAVGAAIDASRRSEPISELVERFAPESRHAPQRIDRDPVEAGAGDPHEDVGLRVAPGERDEVSRKQRIAAAAALRHDIEHGAATERRPAAGEPREAAQHEAITRQQRERRALDVDARKAARADRRRACAPFGGPRQ